MCHTPATLFDILTRFSSHYCSHRFFSLLSKCKFIFLEQTPRENGIFTTGSYRFSSMSASFSLIAISDMQFIFALQLFEVL